MSVSMTALFPACVEVLRFENRPLHYADLTEMALGRVGEKAGPEVVLDAKEDVREKLLKAGGRGTAYTGAPEYMGVLRCWFPSVQQEVGNLEAHRFRIPGSASLGARAGFEAGMRNPHMIRKTSATEGRIWKSRVSGLVIETHVSDWAQRSWPGFWREPENQGKWMDPCPHDFRLDLGGRMFSVDVMGPRSDGSFGTPVGGGKRRVDIHLAANIDNMDVVLHGFIPGRSLSHKFVPEHTHPIVWFVVWLNCEKAGINYKKIGTRIDTISEVD